MDAMQFLDKAAKAKRQPIYALVGDEDFLKRRVRDAIISNILGDADPAFAVSVYSGEKLDFSTIRNDLDTPSFLAPCRIVLVEDADKKPLGNTDAFISAHRPALEKYAGQPSSVGVLVLDVKSFPETTKLAKALPDAAKIACKAPYENKLPAWCVGWAKSAHGKKLNADAAELLVQLVGSAMGLLDQELEKLAVAVGGKAAIEAEDVDRLVGRSSSADVFRILDAIGEGRPKAALGILEALFDEGEDPMAVIGPMTAQLRKLAAVGREVANREPLGQAMDIAGIPKWEKARISCEKQVKWLGLRRLNQLTDWLVEINLGLKGGNALPERVQVERLIVKLARPREEAR
ncbi:MAG TPA: DNA polymerase III subunit delta [Urbifossiella sp.]|jgi:DNA polymerase-3 subunit delta